MYFLKLAAKLRSKYFFSRILCLCLRAIYMYQIVKNLHTPGIIKIKLKRIDIKYRISRAIRWGFPLSRMTTNN